MDLKDYLTCVITPTLKYLNMHSIAAEQLVLGTAVQESGLNNLLQIGGGPALGFFQMEPDTHDDLWKNYLAFRRDLTVKIKTLLAPWPTQRVDQLLTNRMYSCAMCRLQYYRRPEALPRKGIAEEMARYWKKYYNTELGAGTEPTFILNFKERVLPLYK